jgi:antitoxin YefM
MKAMTSSEFRKSLSATLDKVRDDHEPLLVTRPGGNAVVASEEDRAGMEETLYLMRSPRNAANLLESIAQAERGEFVKTDIDFAAEGAEDA